MYKWDDYERVSLGFCEIAYSEFLQMTPLQCYYVLFNKRQRALIEENYVRKIAYYTVAPHWSGGMPLKQLSQIWHIPEIDGNWEDMKLAKPRLMTPSEREFFDNLTKK